MASSRNKACAGLRLNRRQFVRAAGAASLLSLLPASAHPAAGSTTDEPGGARGPGGEPPLPGLPGYRPRVATAWAPPDDPLGFYRSLKSALEAATDFSWLSRGDRVFLKLALNSGNPFPATTDPWLLAYIIPILREKGAGEILVGDQSGVETVLLMPESRRGSSRAHCESSGLMKVLLDAGARPCFFEEAGYDAYAPVVPEGAHHWSEPLWVTRALDEVDHIVYLGRVSSHVLGDITSGMKLGVGFLRDDSRRVFHQGGQNFYAMYEEFQQVPPIRSKLRLMVSSGRKVLSTFGPDDGHVSAPQQALLIASEDLLAHELLSYAWLKWNRRLETPALSRATTGQVSRLRSPINQGFVRYFWGSKPDRGTPAIPFWEAGDIYAHPAVRNFMERMGGRPAGIDWERVRSGFPEGPNEFLSREIAA